MSSSACTSRDLSKPPIPEGIAHTYKSSLGESVYQLVGGLRSDMGYGGAASLEATEALVKVTGYPVFVRASFVMGGRGALWMYEPTQLKEVVRRAISESPVGQA